MKKYDNVIAIDPDVSKSGVAWLHRETRVMEASSLSFPTLLDYLQFAKKTSDESNQSLIVVVEAGWLNKSHWHISSRDNRRTSAAIGNAAGRNHETGRKIVEMCKHYSIEVVEHRPLKKCWKGRDGKITADELKQITGIFGRTNQDARDAALLAWVYAGIPIRIKRQ